MDGPGGADSEGKRKQSGAPLKKGGSRTHPRQVREGEREIEREEKEERERACGQAGQERAREETFFAQEKETEKEGEKKDAPRGKTKAGHKTAAHSCVSTARRQPARRHSAGGPRCSAGQAGQKETPHTGGERAGTSRHFCVPPRSLLTAWWW